jgi:polysaccharide biosynthesis/export protein
VRKQHTLALTIAILLGVSSLTAQAPTPAPLRPSLMGDAGKENLPAQILGVDDLVAVSVYDAPELTRTVRIESDGTIHLPLLTEGVKAAGALPRELEAGVTETLRSEQILVDPIVKITVVEYHSRPIAVMGAVKLPLTFQAVGVVTLLDALAKAGGLSDMAGTEILVTRSNVTHEATETQVGGVGIEPVAEHVTVRRLMKEADPNVNFVLHGGEEILVPEAGKIFVAGNVKKPGAFLVRDGTENSVLKLVALAEGLAPFHFRTAYIYRPDAAGARQEIPVELDKILDRKSPDVPLQVDDLLYIPDNKGKRLTANVIDKLSGFGSAVGSGLIVWH